MALWADLKHNFKKRFPTNMEDAGYTVQYSLLDSSLLVPLSGICLTGPQDGLPYSHLREVFQKDTRK